MRFGVAALLLCSLSAAASAQSCVILAANELPKIRTNNGRGQVHLLTYLAGDYPPGISFRSTIKDKDVEKIKSKDGRVIVLDPQYTREDLNKAKQDCEATVAHK